MKQKMFSASSFGHLRKVVYLSAALDNEMPIRIFDHVFDPMHATGGIIAAKTRSCPFYCK